MELEVTWGRTVTVWWTLFWRNVVALVGGFIAGAILGGVLGLILGLVGASPNTIRIVVSPIAFVLGLAISVVPMKLILGKDFGEFRLVLLPKKETASGQS
ncbi:MAG: hypothetical protein EXR78_04600 [Deltaproteobacteria bacterium]|nr:hypothetical protein [Deltaproteobacteria bacterium]